MCVYIYISIYMNEEHIHSLYALIYPKQKQHKLLNNNYARIKYWSIKCITYQLETNRQI